jgi:hypothetical protein
VIGCASLLHDQHPPRSNMKLLALLSLALLATALFVDAKTEKDVTSLHIGVKVGLTPALVPQHDTQRQSSTCCPFIGQAHTQWQYGLFRTLLSIQALI